VGPLGRLGAVVAAVAGRHDLIGAIRLAPIHEGHLRQVGVAPGLRHVLLIMGRGSGYAATVPRQRRSSTSVVNAPTCTRSPSRSGITVSRAIGSSE
jgi:hypothetical protein